MAKRSLPERTVDAWVAASICGAFPNALIWGPTQRVAENWDYGVSLGDGKVFILEDKATTPVVRSAQLPLNTDETPAEYGMGTASRIRRLAC